MIQFDDYGDDVVLIYSPDRGPADWLDEKLNAEGSYRLALTFTLYKQHLMDDEQGDARDSGVRRFVIGKRDRGYRRIWATSLGLKHDLLIHNQLTLTRKMFIAQQNISIFRRIDELSDEEIVIGGERDGAIPAEEFVRLLGDFPTTTEMRLYSYARVTRILEEYMETMSDAEAKLADYFDRRRRSRATPPAVMGDRLPEATELELEKFTFVRERLSEMLGDAESFSEAEWQRTVADLFLLIFPQYIAVLQKVRVKERYSRNPSVTSRELDLVLVAANGSIDVLEIKKPFSNGLMSARKYRDNHVPVRELSGTIVQVEKYLFYLSKSGPDGESAITEKYAAELPTGLKIRITNPKAYVLSGRDDNFTDQQIFDFEFVRRKYSNMVDIITYDDLLRRLDNILLSLGRRTDVDETVGGRAGRDESGGPVHDRGPTG